MFLGAFGEYAIVAAEQAVPVPKALPFDRGCLLGCGVMTGVGAALNIASIGHGDAVMVIGCGAVGLSAVQGARLAGAGAIVAVDLDDKKLDLAEAVGATMRVNAGREDPVAVARKVGKSGRGVDVVLEAAGNPAGLPRQHRGGAARRRGDLARQDRCRTRCGFPLGRADGRKAHPPVELWRHPPGARLSDAGRRPISTAASSSMS